MEPFDRIVKFCKSKDKKNKFLPFGFICMFYCFDFLNLNQLNTFIEPSINISYENIWIEFISEFERYEDCYRFLIIFGVQVKEYFKDDTLLLNIFSDLKVESEKEQDLYIKNLFKKSKWYLPEKELLYHLISCYEHRRELDFNILLNEMENHGLLNDRKSNISRKDIENESHPYQTCLKIHACIIKRNDFNYKMVLSMREILKKKFHYDGFFIIDNEPYNTSEKTYCEARYYLGNDNVEVSDDWSSTSGSSSSSSSSDDE